MNVVTLPLDRRFVPVALASLAVLLSLPGQLSAQTPDPSAIPDKAYREPLPPPRGKILFSTEHGAPVAPVAATSSSSRAEDSPEPGPADQRPAILVTNDERSRVQIIRSQLNLHLFPATARAETQAELTIVNLADEPVSRIPLQLTSTLRWQSVVLHGADGLHPLGFTQSPIATDADHTGYAQEAVIALPTALAPHSTVTVSVFYTGTIRPSAARLELIGAPADKAAETDWDGIVPTTDRAATGLRGFGDVLWYPVAAPTASFGDTNKLFELIRRQRLRSAAMGLELTVEYVGDPPDGAIFDGVLQPLAKAPDASDQLVAETHGVATASFALVPAGFRTPSLFLTAQQPVTTDDQLLTVVSPDEDAAVPYAEAAAALATQLKAWLGPGPRVPLLLVDHAGEPFEDGGLLVGRLNGRAKAPAIAPELVRALTHAWFDPGLAADAQPAARESGANHWLSAGVAELMALVSTEDLLGREAAIAQLQQAYVLLGLSEPLPAGISSSSPAAKPPAGAQPDLPGPVEPQPLTAAYSDAYVRYKSLAVLWQLREQLGEDLLRTVLTTYHHAATLNPQLMATRTAFQQSLEQTTGRDFGWFFNDWVYRDSGLPDLSLGEVNARALPAGTGKYSGYLVAIEVRNVGGAVADVPVTVTNDTLTASQRIRVPAHSSASIRIVFEGRPEAVQVNDGSVPEAGALVHTAHVRVEEGDAR